MLTMRILKVRLFLFGFVLLGLCGSRGYAQAPAEAKQEIVVQGVASISVKPDVAMVVVGVVTSGQQATLASKENARLSALIVKAVKAQGVADNDIQTETYSVDSQVVPDMSKKPMRNPVGVVVYPDKTVYQVTNIYRIVVRKIGTVGNILDAAFKAGANRSDGVSFEIKDKERYYQEALAKAVENATQKAGVLAKAAGAGTPALQRMVEGYGNGTAVANERMNGAYDNNVVGIKSGQVDVSATVTCYFTFSK